MTEITWQEKLFYTREKIAETSRRNHFHAISKSVYIQPQDFLKETFKIKEEIELPAQISVPLHSITLKFPRIKHATIHKKVLYSMMTDRVNMIPISVSFNHCSCD